MKIDIRDLSFTYPADREKGQEAKEVLRHVSLSFSDERPTILLAPSGSGKTTLLRILCGFLRPDSGSIEGLSGDERLSVVFQEDRLFETMDVYRNWKIVRPDLGPEDAETLASELGLSKDVLTQRPATLSGGMRRRVAVGRALIYPSRVVLMDEPFQGLDDETRARVIRTVKERCQGKALLIITHDPEDAGLLGAGVLHLE